MSSRVVKGSEKAEEARTEHDKERSESKKDEAESPGSVGLFDDPASANAKDAGKADAEAERAQDKSDD